MSHIVSALLKKKMRERNVYFWSDFGLPEGEKIVIIILMTNMFIKLSLNSKTLITSSSKETAGTPAEVRVKLPCFFIQTVGTVNVAWAEPW